METTGPMQDSGGDGDGDGRAPAAVAVRLQGTPPIDFDGTLEPMTRCRANTWPCRPSNSVVDEENRSTPTSVDGDQTDGMRDGRDPTLGGLPGARVLLGGGTTRKAAARRNAWGNLSYADLITRAIESSPEKRLTLSQIYSWMVENVPFFKDKGDSNSSAGWKNSIRHNLSLHSKFMRVQNESTGKSSWWVINPDVKHLKTPRRRAATMDNTKVSLQHRRNRLKGCGLTRVASSEHPLMAYAYDGSSDHLDAAMYERVSPEILGLASQNYRVRSSSNASSIGRLSPIPATAEHDMDNSQFGMPPPSSALSWKNICLPPESGTETLSESLASIFVEDVKKPMLVGDACCGNAMIPDSNVMIQNGNVLPQSANVMTPSRGNIMVSNVSNTLNQNGGNIVAQNGDGPEGFSRNHIGVNGSMLGLHSYSRNAVGLEGSSGVPMPLNMWPLYSNQQSNRIFPLLLNPAAGEAHLNRVLYNGKVEYSMLPSISRSGVPYYNDSRSQLSGNLCHSASSIGFSQYGVSNVNNQGPPYGSASFNDLIKQESEPPSCLYFGSNGDHKTEMSGSGLKMGSISPMTNTIKVEKPSGPFPSERQDCVTNWQDQQQQQQLSWQPVLGRSLGPIDPRKLMKILAEKPHLKEKMLQLIQLKRQQLTQQQQLNSGTLPGHMTTTTVSHLADPTHSKQNLTDLENSVNQRPGTAATSITTTTTTTTTNTSLLPESSMPVDIDLDFDTTPTINCDIDQVIQHEMTFGELDFSLDPLQVTQSNNDMDYNSFHF